MSIFQSDFVHEKLDIKEIIKTKPNIKNIIKVPMIIMSIKRKKKCTYINENLEKSKHLLTT